MRFRAFALILTTIFFSFATPAAALTSKDADRWARPVSHAQAVRHGRHSVAYRKWVIQQVWGNHARIGLRLSYCESGYRVEAKDYADGAHWGLYQMGHSERATYGYGRGAWAQARGGLRLYLKRHTSPWDSSKTCWRIRR